MQEKARKIIKAVRGLTTDAQFGIGGYTDKPIVPFANEPKEGGEKAHQKVFAFQHHLTITDDSNALTKAIGNVHFLPLDDVGGGRNNAFYTNAFLPNQNNKFLEIQANLRILRIRNNKFYLSTPMPNEFHQNRTTNSYKTTRICSSEF